VTARSPLRILFITPFFPPDYTGGAEVSLYHSARGLMARDVSVSILTINTRMAADADDCYDLDGLPVHRVRFGSTRPGGEIYDARVARAVRQEIDLVQPDVMHIHNASGASLAPFVAAKRANVPVVNTLHDHWLLCPNNMLLREDFTVCDPAEHSQGCANCLRRYDYWADVPRRRQLFARLTNNARFLSPSQALIDFHARAGYDPARFCLVRLGFAEEADQPVAHRALRTAARAAAKGPLIAFSGGSVVIKGSNVVVAMLPHLYERVPEARVAIAGPVEGTVAAALQMQHPNALLLGRLPFKAMRQLFARADLALMPSIWPENSPVTIFENHQVGTPVVGSRIGGIPELVEEGRTGYLVPPGDPEALARAIATHLARPAVDQRRMRQACVESVRALSLERHVDALLAVYAEVLAEESGG
jgi:glycosyltransferase involved in cell wall biosynthesis